MSLGRGHAGRFVRLEMEILESDALIDVRQLVTCCLVNGTSQ